MDKHTSGN